uniref:(northern house mosquito) hypothetical protein n=1 Tax=Culex pipiens TaxID=7175 RepID=A0A8D8FUV6_CULPI
MFLLVVWARHVDRGWRWRLLDLLHGCYDDGTAIGGTVGRGRRCTVAGCGRSFHLLALLGKLRCECFGYCRLNRRSFLLIDLGQHLLLGLVVIRNGVDRVNLAQMLL